jgi:hypothetical protein
MKYTTINLEEPAKIDKLYQIRYDCYCVVDKNGHFVCGEFDKYPLYSELHWVAKILLDNCKRSGGPGVEVKFYDMIMIEFGDIIKLGELNGNS